MNANKKIKLIDFLKAVSAEKRAEAYSKVIGENLYHYDEENGWLWEATWTFDTKGNLILKFFDELIKAEMKLCFTPKGSFDGLFHEKCPNNIPFWLWNERCNLWVETGKSLAQDFSLILQEIEEEE